MFSTRLSSMLFEISVWKLAWPGPVTIIKSRLDVITHEFEGTRQAISNPSSCGAIELTGIQLYPNVPCLHVIIEMNCDFVRHAA